VWFAATATSRTEAISGWLVAAGLIGTTVVSLANLAGIGFRIQNDDGAIARSVALGAALLVIAIVMFWRNKRSRVERPAGAGPWQQR
jgi:hypothetical protein